MEKILRGKFLIRKGTSSNGREFLTITGVTIPNFPLSEIKDNDEMWVTDLIVSGGFRYTGPLDNTHSNCSPEEFLEGVGQNKSLWKHRENL